jgi:integrase
MPYSNVPAFVRRLRDACSTSSLALEFAILAAARSGEVMGCRWEEFSLVERLWTVPASRMKSGREHVVPLTDRMLEILRTVKGEASRDGSDYVFPGAKPHRPLSVMALAMALRRAGGGEFTVHGFRSSFRDWCGDQTAFPREIAEAALAHTIKDATERAYRRGNALVKRTELMEAWVRYINEGGANVIQLATARAG